MDILAAEFQNGLDFFCELVLGNSFGRALASHRSVTGSVPSVAKWDPVVIKLEISGFLLPVETTFPTKAALTVHQWKLCVSEQLYQDNVYAHTSEYVLES